MLFLCLFGGEFGTAVEYFARNFTTPIHPPLVAVSGPSQEGTQLELPNITKNKVTPRIMKGFIVM
jgi:hypothetical protein